MPAKFDRCLKKVMGEGKSEEQAYAICTASLKDEMAQTPIKDEKKNIEFTDKITFDEATRRCISVRDGFQEYYGSELGMEPSSQLFTIYRSRETIDQAEKKMQGIPVTVGHVSLTEQPIKQGSVITSRLVDLYDNSTATTAAIENELELGQEAKDIEQREFSLGYFADIVPHEGEFDFEQINIVPHHLAIVEAGRCGPVCSFSDSLNQKEGENVKKLFRDEDGQLNMQQIIEAVTALPEVIKSVPLDKLQEIMPAVNELVAAAKSAGVEIEEVMPEEEPAAEEEPMEDADPEEEKKEMVDSAKFKDALSKGISDAITVVEKAKDFLPEEYKFSDKLPCKIMRDALATQYGNQSFEDSELKTAFKLLKKSAEYKDFAPVVTGLNQLKDKEL